MMDGPIKRRTFIATLSSAASWPVVARGQHPAKVWRIGFLSGASRTAMSDIFAGFTEGMRDLGYVEGKDFLVEWRFADGDFERFPSLAAELAQLKVDIFVLGTTAAIPSVQHVASNVPIILAISTDPVGSGFAESLRHPGGNITGLASSTDESSPKQIELLAAVVPNLSRIGFLGNPSSPQFFPLVRAAQAAAQTAKFRIVLVEARSPSEIEKAFTDFADERVGAIMVHTDALFMSQRQRIADLALQGRLASMFSQREYAEAGGLMSYGEDLKSYFRRAASFVDKIFKGVKPGDLPIEQPTKFNLTINRKTAAALGLTIPPRLYIFADEVIE
jgi:putative ABC transport system substrate-binding protein